MARSTSLHFEIMRYYTVRRFDGGLNDQYSRNLLLDNQAEDILNFDLTTKGSIKVRRGSSVLNTRLFKDTSAIISAAVSASTLSALYLSGGTLLVAAGVISATGGGVLYSQVGNTAPVRGLTRYYNTSSTNEWVAFCSGRVHFGTSIMSSYLTQTFAVDSDMDFVTFADTMLMYNGTTQFTSKLRSASDTSAWTNAPIMNVLRPWQDRLWCVPTASAYVVRFTSAIGSLVAWGATNYFTVGKQDGGTIIGLEVFQGNLIIFKTTGVYTMVGTNPENYQLEQMTDKGCISKGSIVVGDTGIIYLSSDGVRLFDGVLSQMLSEADDYWLDITGVMNKTRISKTKAIYFDRKYILGYDDASAAETLNNRAWVFNFRTGTWTKYTFRANGMVRTQGANEDASLYFGSSVSGVIFKMFSGTTDYAQVQGMSAAIVGTFKTKSFDMSDQQKERINEEKQFLKVSVQGSMDAGSILMKTEVDGGYGPAQLDSLEFEGSGGFLLDTDVLDVGVLGSGSNRFSHEREMATIMAGKTIGHEFTASDLAQTAEIDAIIIGYREKGNRG